MLKLELISMYHLQLFPVFKMDLLGLMYPGPTVQ